MTRCGLCSEQIDVPVCPLCLTDKMESWVERKKLSLVKPYREAVRNMLDKARYGKISCKVCRGENEKAVCMSCFSNKIYGWLETKDKDTAKVFVKDFTIKIKTPKQSKMYA